MCKSNSSITFQEPTLYFPGLSRSILILQHFPGTGNFIKINQGLCRIFHEASNEGEGHAQVKKTSGITNVHSRFDLELEKDTGNNRTQHSVE